MFNRKLKERVARLERLINGNKGTPRVVGNYLGIPYVVGGDPAVAGLQDKVNALSEKLGVEYKKTPDKAGAWTAVEKPKAKGRKR